MSKYYAIFTHDEHNPDNLIGVTSKKYDIHKFIASLIYNGTYTYGNELTADLQAKQFLTDYKNNPDIIYDIDFVVIKETTNTPDTAYKNLNYTTTIHNGKISINFILQEKFGIFAGDLFEIYCDDTSVYLKKVPVCIYCKIKDTNRLIKFNNRYICKDCAKKIKEMKGKNE
ncbi:MAG: hypothetical protein IJ571_00215 [Ruminococcus sp.]|nr:hypothetical protein [Ruminococcus sp.]